MSIPKDGWTTAQIYAVLDLKYSDRSAYVTLRECPDGTGYNKSRTADLIVASCWRSHGINLTGFEVKQSRSDWQKEMSCPEKSDALGRYCKYWYLAVGHASIVKDGELPDAWGLMAPKGDKLVVVKAAPPRDVVPFDLETAVAMFRHIRDRAPGEKEVREAREAGRRDVSQQNAVRLKDEIDRAKKHATDETARLRRQIDEFEAASGVRIDQYSGNRRIGEIVKLVLNNNIEAIDRAMEQARRSVRICADSLDQYAEERARLKAEAMEGAAS